MGAAGGSALPVAVSVTSHVSVLHVCLCQPHCSLKGQQQQHPSAWAESLGLWA